ncbi:hypothetical protein LMH87_011248 [Akanthomyces muscarius]|uniref:THIF-type NAD/FAD binding fold domain-containing protein n=1 Tax=Akanthomyces muscarius TaxID=2231603 RepID=A0A9W8UKX2_AKAMU|nr:hypothetical protein LMH87_011248 [Akanthomyces muscarius]KAJ4150500.1 hypothetical protein LMH87_011248 [Akanthomyces muscarius]
MSGYISNLISTPRGQLITTAVFSGAAVATLIFGYQALEREERLSALKNSIPSINDGKHHTSKLNSFGASNENTEDKEDARNLALAQRAQAGDFDEELILEQLARNQVFLTPEGLDKLRKSFVVVVGCGGVGSHCTASLARSGVSRLRLIDFDQVTLSSLNRHSVATLADVEPREGSGEGKAELLPLDQAEFEKGSVGDLGVMPNFRVRILPVLGTMPAIFGMTAANHVILSITGYPVDYAPAKGRDKMYDGIVNYVQSTEEKLARLFAPDLIGLRSPITAGDVAFLTEELYRARSVVTGIPTRLTLIRWRRPQGINVSVIGEGTSEEQKCSTIRLRDLVCMTKDEAVRHEKQIFKVGVPLEDLYDAETIARVERKMAQAAEYEKHRW